MKAIFGSALLAATLFSVAALADTVSITSTASVGAPTEQITSTSVWAQNPTTPMLTVNVAGKQCSLVSSAKAIGPIGCNYKLEVAPNGAITGSLAAGNNGCTPTPQVASSCK
jgi:hypothetical protein